MKQILNQQNLVTLPEMKVIGLSIEINKKENPIILEQQIKSLKEKYFKEEISNKIKNKVNENIILIIQYKEKVNKKDIYYYLIGQEVKEFNNNENDLKQLLIPGHVYIKFTPLENNEDLILKNINSILEKNNFAIKGYEKTDLFNIEVYKNKSLLSQGNLINFFATVKPIRWIFSFLK